VSARLAAVYTLLLGLMYLPVTPIIDLEGLALYAYWTLTSIAALALAWHATRRW